MSPRRSTTPPEAFGLAVRQFRSKAGLTQEALAHEAGISLTSVARIETGGHGVRLETILGLAAALGISAGTLITECERILAVSPKAK